METPTVELVKASWGHASRHADGVAACFYQRLFELDPTLEPLFATVDMDTQGRKFVSMMNTFVEMLEDPDGLTELLLESGRRHADYGVRSHDYLTVGEAFLWALAEQLGDDFDERTRAAWAEGYTRIASIMKMGPQSVAM